MRMIGCTSPRNGGRRCACSGSTRPRTASRSGPASASCRRPTSSTPSSRCSRTCHLRPLLRHPARRVQAPGGRAARVRPADRPRHEQGRLAVGRHEAAGDDRPLADQRARAAAARRADDGPRPAGPPRPVGPPVPAQAAGRHARADDALHGRGRAAVRPPRRDGRRPDRRRGIAPPADRAALDPRGARAALPGRHQRGRRRASTGIGERQSRSCRTASSCTPTTARRRSPWSTTAASSPESALVRRSSLEDVFLRLTGRTLVDEMSTPAAVRVWGSSFALYKRIWRSNLVGSLAPAAAVPARDGRRRRLPRRPRHGADEILGGVDYVAFLAPALLAIDGDDRRQRRRRCGRSRRVLVEQARSTRWPPRRCARRDIAGGVALWHATRALHRRGRRGGRAGRGARARGRGGSAGGDPVRRADRHGVRGADHRVVGDARRAPISRSPRSCASASCRCSCSPARSTRSTSCPAGSSRSPSVTPLYHGVELCRGAVLGHARRSVDGLVHVAVLLAFWGVGSLVPAARFARRLAE